MKTSKHGLKLYFVVAFCVTAVFIDAMGQFGTSRRVARRTSRRTATRVNARQNGYYGGGAVYGGGAAYGGGTVSALPGGCVLRAISGINYQYCGGVYYRPYYEGEQVVYVIENP